MIAAALNTTPAAFPDWHFHPDVWVLVALLEGAYLYAVRSGRASTKQVVLFTAGVATILVASEWPVHDLAEGYLYSAHMVQHLLMTLVAAPLLLLGTPQWLAQRILRPKVLLTLVKGFSRPVPNLLQANLVLVLSHWPLVVAFTLRNHPAHFLAHAVLLTSGLLMWMPVVSPLKEVPRLGPLMQMLYLFLQTIVPTIPASFLTLGRGLLYPDYGTFPRLWGISAITDQQVAGLIMKIGAGMYLWLIIFTIFFRWYAREEAKPRDVLFWEDVEQELQRTEPRAL